MIVNVVLGFGDDDPIDYVFHPDRAVVGFGQGGLVRSGGGQFQRGPGDTDLGVVQVIVDTTLHARPRDHERLQRARRREYFEVAGCIRARAAKGGTQRLDTRFDRFLAHDEEIGALEAAAVNNDGEAAYGVYARVRVRCERSGRALDSEEVVAGRVAEHSVRKVGVAKMSRWRVWGESWVPIEKTFGHRATEGEFEVSGSEVAWHRQLQTS
jgi:hypothetical protein